MSGKIVGVSLVIAVLAVAFLGMVAYSATVSRPSQADTIGTVAITSDSTPSTISVPGVGIASATPDEVQLVLGVTNSGPNATSVLMQNSANMSAVISAIEKGVGINSSDVQTTNFNFGPTYAQYSNTINGYQASNSVQVTLQGSDVSKLDSVINAAVNAGVNQIREYPVHAFKLTTDTAPAGGAEGCDRERKPDRASSSDIREREDRWNTKCFSPGIELPTELLLIQQPRCCRVGTTEVNYAVPIEPGQTQFSVQVQVVYLLG